MIYVIYVNGERRATFANRDAAKHYAKSQRVGFNKVDFKEEK